MKGIAAVTLVLVVLALAGCDFQDIMSGLLVGRQKDHAHTQIEEGAAMAEAQVLIERTSVIKLEGDISRVFPLFTPLGEREWAEGWDPTVVWPADESVQERMVFTVRHGDGPETMWLVSKHDEQFGLIEYTVYESESVHWILLRCSAAENGKSTNAEITYTYVGTNEDACQKNVQQLASMYKHNLKDWEYVINHYLRTGERITHH